MAGALGISLPARGSAPCSTSGRTPIVTASLSGSSRAVRRRVNVQCCAPSDNTSNHNLSSKQPLDSIDYEWRALNQDRTRTYFSDPSEPSLWDMIDLSATSYNHPHEQHAAGAANAQLEFKDRFWECTPSSTTDHWDEHSRVHVLLFGIGEGEAEGIYSVRAMPGADQLPQETIIAFEDAEDAQRYASQLEATMDRASNVVPITPSELLEFCQESGYNCRLEQGGSMLSPPDFNVDITDWERSLRLRNGMWSVVDDSIDESSDLLLESSAQYPFLDSSTMPHNNAGVYLPNDSVLALEELRTRLERLMQFEG